jgi:hypothetical protein
MTGMTSWTDVSNEPLGLVLDDAVTTTLNTIGAAIGLAPVLWSLSTIELYSDRPDEPSRRTNVLVNGNVREAGFPDAPNDYDVAEVAHAWARLLNLAHLTGGPAGRLGFAGQHEKINVYLLAVVDPTPFAKTPSAERRSCGGRSTRKPGTRRTSPTKCRDATPRTSDVHQHLEASAHNVRLCR